MSDISAFQPEVWTSSSNEAVKLFVTDSEGAVNIQPEFTYPIFGDSESIYGYKNLVIYVCFDHYTFKPFLNIKYDKKLDNDDIIDLKSTLMKYLPKSTIFKDEIEWVDATKQEKVNYTIPGEKLVLFDNNDQQYSIYKINLQDSVGLELNRRLQILTLLYIEAGTFIDTNDELWDLYVLYKQGDEKQEQEPSIVGFTTVYNYWKYSGFEKFDADIKQIRTKISQFIILPNYQQQNLGGQFYSHLYEIWLKNSQICEIVVEDPNEKFDDMRDRCDLKLLYSKINFDDIDINSPNLSEIRKTYKFESRQFARLIEMILLYKLKNEAKGNAKQIRLFIKSRLYRKNKEGLQLLDDATRKDKLQTAYESLEADYYRILVPVRFKQKRSFENDNNNKRIKV